jgi:hypothetical protein
LGHGKFGVLLNSVLLKRLFRINKITLIICTMAQGAGLKAQGFFAAGSSAFLTA